MRKEYSVEGLLFQVRENKIKKSHKVELVLSNDDLTEENLDKVFNAHKNTKIVLSSNSFELTEKNINNVIYLNEKIKTRYKSEICFDKSGWSIKKVFYATSKLQEWAKEINDARVDGRGLSPYEKFLYAYQIVTQFEYHESKGDAFKARDVVKIINGKFKNIVCAGYASILEALCKMIGINCHQNKIPVDVLMGEIREHHAKCFVELHDEKYDMDGVYDCDPCWDCRQKGHDSTYYNALVDYNVVYPIYGNTVLVYDSEIKSQIKEKADECGCLNCNPLEQDYINEAIDFVKKKVLHNIKTMREKYKNLNDEDDRYGYRGDKLEAMVDVASLVFVERKNGIKNHDISNIMNRSLVRNKTYQKILQSFSDEEINKWIDDKLEGYIKSKSFAHMQPNEKFLLWASSKMNATELTAEKHFIPALTSVFMAKGMTKERAERKAKECFEESVKYCCESCVIGKGSRNMFVDEAYNRYLERAQEEIE